MSELIKLKSMLQVLEPTLNKRLDDIESKMARHDDVMAMRDTLESVSVEFATTLDDKREAGDVLLHDKF